MVTVNYTILWANAADCGVPLVNSNVTLNYTSTLEDSILTLRQTCESNTSTDGEILGLSVTCHSSGNWIPNPAQFTCSPYTTVPSGTETLIRSSPYSSGSKYLSHYLMFLKQTMNIGTYTSSYTLIWAIILVFCTLQKHDGCFDFIVGHLSSSICAHDAWLILFLISH